MSLVMSLESTSLPMISVVALLIVGISYVAMKTLNKKKNYPDHVDADGLSTQYKPLKLIGKTQYNHNTIIFKFALPSNTNKMGLSIGSHVMLKYKSKDDEFGVARPYTPITNDFDINNRGYFELMIKIYPNGKMTQHLNKLNIGDTMQIKKYNGKLEYKSNGYFIIRNIGHIRNIKKIGMIAGGTGITPLLQLIRYAIHCGDDVDINLLFANKTKHDILLKDELEAINNDNTNKINVYFTVSKINQQEKEEWNGGVGRIDVDMINKYTFQPANDVMMLLCGPKPMTQSMVSYLDKIGHAKNRVFTF